MLISTSTSLEEGSIFEHEVAHEAVDEFNSKLVVVIELQFELRAYTKPSKQRRLGALRLSVVVVCKFNFWVLMVLVFLLLVTSFHYP